MTEGSSVTNFPSCSSINGSLCGKKEAKHTNVILAGKMIGTLKIRIQQTQLKYVHNV